MTKLVQLSFAVLLWFCAVKHFNRVDFDQETDRACKGAQLQLASQGCHLVEAAK